MANEFMVIDIETTGLSPHKDNLHGVGISFEEDGEEYYPAWELPDWLRGKLADPNVTKIAFNAKFDLGFLVAKGYEVRGRIIDVMLMSMAVDENLPRGLKFLSEKYLGPESLQNKKSLDIAMEQAGVKNVGALNRIDLDDPAHPYLKIVARYCREDLRNTLKLYFVLRDRLRDIDKKARSIFKVSKSPLDYLKEEVIPVEPVLLAMETGGVRVNVGAIAEVRDDADRRMQTCSKHLNMLCRTKIEEIENELYEKAVAARKSPKGKAKVEKGSEKYKTKFVWESGQHLGKLIYEKYALSPALVRKTDKGAYTTTETYLKFLNTALIQGHPLKEVLSVYGKWKKAQKIYSTYTGDGDVGITSHIIDRNGIPYIFGRFPQTTNTGRLAPKEPNLANLPRNSPVKRFFVPRDEDHVFAYFDFSQLELRIAAHLSRDEAFVEAYTLGIDLHRRTAAAAFGIEPEQVTDLQRQVGKTANFLLIYWGGAKRLMQELHDKNGLDFSEEECKSFREAFFRTYATYAAYLQKELAFGRKFKMTISETGRVRRLPDLVFGDFLDWRTTTFSGPPALVARLKNHPYEKLEGGELFWRAQRRYSHATKALYNFKPQHIGSAITKRGMIALHDRGFRTVNQIHDAVIVELPKHELARVDEIKHVLENTYTISVPLKVESKLLNSFDEKDVFDVSVYNANALSTNGAPATMSTKKAK